MTKHRAWLAIAIVPARIVVDALARCSVPRPDVIADVLHAINRLVQRRVSPRLVTKRSKPTLHHLPVHRLGDRSRRYVAEVLNPEKAHTFRGGPLGNFARCDLDLPSPIDGANRFYVSVEHYFQACKAIAPRDHDLVASQPTPKGAKKAGGLVSLRSDWEAVKEEVMLAALRRKFSKRRFRSALLATGDQVIAEDSPRDFEWGARDPAGGWGGANKLGLLLMQIRDGSDARVISKPPLKNSCRCSRGERQRGTGLDLYRRRRTEPPPASRNARAPHARPRFGCTPAGR